MFSQNSVVFETVLKSAEIRHPKIAIARVPLVKLGSIDIMISAPNRKNNLLLGAILTHFSVHDLSQKRWLVGARYRPNLILGYTKATVPVNTQKKRLGFLSTKRGQV